MNDTVSKQEINPFSVTCPTCRAMRGKMCRLPNGKQKKNFHQSRYAEARDEFYRQTARGREAAIRAVELIGPFSGKVDATPLGDTLRRACYKLFDDNTGNMLLYVRVYRWNAGELIVAPGLRTHGDIQRESVMVTFDVTDTARITIKTIEV